jgi:hypothetical protein
MRAASLDFEEEVRREVSTPEREPLTVCSERIRLTESHAIKALALSTLTANLRTKTGAELLEARIANDKEAEECAAAWIALQEHKAQHGCQHYRPRNRLFISLEQEARFDSQKDRQQVLHRKELCF